MKKFKSNSHIVYLIILILMIILSFTSAFQTIDYSLRDALYQSPSHANSSVYVIGIDEQTLSAYGNKLEDWDREKLADMIRLLNSDPDTAPVSHGDGSN